MDDGGLSSGALHLDGLVGGQGRVFQGDGVEAGSVLHAVAAEVRGRCADVAGFRCWGGNKRLPDTGVQKQRRGNQVSM